MPPGGRDCWLPHNSGAGLCWQHVGGVGSTTTTTTNTEDIFGSLVGALDNVGVVSARAVSVAKDGAPSMTEKNAGVAVKFKGEGACCKLRAWL